jgi:hypothetical protein
MQFGSSMPIQLFGRGCCRVFHSWRRAMALQRQKTRADGEGVGCLGDNMQVACGQGRHGRQDATPEARSR